MCNKHYVLELKVPFILKYMLFSIILQEDKVEKPL